MKFAATILFTVALALGVQSSVIPAITQIAGHGLSYTAVSSPIIASPWAPWGHSVVHAAPVHAAVAVHAAHAHPSVAVHAVHAHPSVAVHAAPIVVPAVQGSYVAQTRGAVHTAPLAGHANSVANINVAPAPGTI